MTTLKKISLFLFALVLLGSCTKIVPIDRDGTGDSPIIIRGAEDGGDDLDAGDDGGITDPDDDGDDTLGGSAPGGITDADDDMDDDGSGDVITDPDDDDDVIVDPNGGKGDADTGSSGAIIKG